MKVQKQQFKRAKALHKGNRLVEAEAIYLRLLDQNPADVECLQLLGLIHADTDRVDTSLQLLRLAIGIAGPKPWLCRNLGIILERNGDLAAAAACYRQALEEAPIEQVVVTNTVPIPDERSFAKLRVLSIAPLIASGLRAVFEDASVSEIFNGANQV